MSIEKINALKIATTTSTQNISLSPSNNDVTVSEENKKLSESVKYMIGASILAGSIAFGLIAHNKGWFSKTVKKVQNNIDSSSIPSENKNTPKAETFNKLFTEYGNECDYTSKLENGNTIIVHKENQPATFIQNGTEYDINIPLNRYSLRDKEGRLIYETSHEQDSIFRPEVIFDYDTMTEYKITTTSRSIFGEASCPFAIITKSQFEMEANCIKTKNAISVSYEEFEQARKKMLDKIIPSSLNTLKSKFIKLFRHNSSSRLKEFERSNLGTRTFTRDLDGKNKIVYTKRPDGTLHFSIGMCGSSYKPYAFRVDNFDGKLYEVELVNLPDGRFFRKFFDENTNEYRFEKHKNGDFVEISQEQFTKKKNYAIAEVLPDGITSKFKPKAQALPKNSDGNYIIAVRDRKFEIRISDTNKIQYKIEVDKNGKIVEYKKFNENGKPIEYGVLSINNRYELTQGKNVRKEGSYEECGLHKIEELLKDITGISD